MDRVWWDQFAEEIRTDAELWTSAIHTAKTYGLNLIDSENGGGVSTKPGMIRRGGNSGFQCVGLALHFGASRVVLVGYDMQFTGGKTHWHGDHPAGMGNPVEKRFRMWRTHFETLAAETKVPIVNASRETALRCFPRIGLREALCARS